MIGHKIVQHRNSIADFFFVQIIRTANSQELFHLQSRMVCQVLLQEYCINQSAVRMPQAFKTGKRVFLSQNSYGSVKHSSLLLDIFVTIAIILKTNHKNGVSVLSLQIPTISHSTVIPDLDPNQTMVRMLAVIEFSNHFVKTILRC